MSRTILRSLSLSCLLLVIGALFTPVRAQDLPHNPILTKEELLRDVRKLIRLPDKIPTPIARLAGTEKHKGYVLNSWVFETEPGIRVPGIEVVPEGFEQNVILVPGSGLAKELSIATALEKKARILAVDLRDDVSDREFRDLLVRVPEQHVVDIAA